MSSSRPPLSRSPDLRARAPSGALLPFLIATTVSGAFALPVRSAPAPAPAPCFSDTLAPFPLRELAAGVYAVPGDSGKGSEGRPNAAFVVTDEGVLAIDALASPHQGERLLRSIRSVTAEPVRWLVLTHHHPDHHFGAVALRRAGARVLAHPDRVTLAAEEGEAALIEAWTAVVGVEEMRGFAFADRPDVPVTRDTVLELGGRRVELLVPGAAHTPGDVLVWLPAERVLFAGDLLVEDGVTMVVDGSSAALLTALSRLVELGPRIAVPGHGRIAADPAGLIGLTREYVEGVRAEMAQAFREGRPLSRVLGAMPPAEEGRPVSRASRVRRNAVRVYREMEREMMGLADPDGPEGRKP